MALFNPFHRGSILQHRGVCVRGVSRSHGCQGGYPGVGVSVGGAET